ncbi:related to ISA1 - mitochondrial matrix protein involved in biogenesis of the iron-sulfur cluster of Fe/S proteins [Ustilago trichophora]|uniref:Related to ISA1 - mitochondrial matrix protein involved in biogenesis of the iron-sulfur cluster of Fe/S proteins n=1 Tax=Ustilago trichophora TaxID=86804 RepID=A0A5C3EL50_9BASI|nr:related to ISA1 - mitochondrial matrix protein involved in biogenesis of the iron-sulfur cluster of Fe/S proteins [Ustilago trichophora]
MRSILQSTSARSALSSAQASTSATRLASRASRRALSHLASSSKARTPLLASTIITLPSISASTSSLLVRTSQVRLATTLLRKPDEPEEPEVYRDGEPTIIATERAISQLQKVAERENNPSLALRVAVEPGGCHGYQYKMELTEEIEDDDFQFEVHPGVCILVDSISLALVRGSTIDYVTELIGSQFAIKNNPQAKGAGCGCGVSWEPVI